MNYSSHYQNELLTIDEVDYLYRRGSVYCMSHKKSDQRAIKLYIKGEIDFLLIDVIGKEPEILKKLKLD